MVGQLRYVYTNLKYILEGTRFSSRRSRTVTCLGNGERARQPDVPRGRTDADTESSARDDPILALNIPVTQIPLSEIESSSSRCPGCQRQLVKATQLLRRCRRSRGRESQIQLCDLGAANSAAVGDGAGDGGYLVEEISAAAGSGLAGRWARLGCRCDLDVGISEIGVR